MTALALTKPAPAAPLVPSRDDDAWVPIGRAAELLAKSEGQLRRLCLDQLSRCGQAKQMKDRASGRTSWHIHCTYHPNLLRKDVANFVLPLESAAAQLRTFPKAKVDAALQKVAIVRLYQEWRKGAHTRRDFPKFVELAKSKLGDSVKVSRASIYVWVELCPATDDNAELALALIDRRTGPGIATACSDEAWAAFESYYLDDKKPTLAKCYRTVAALAKKHKWNWPSITRVKELREQRIEPARECYHREGPTAHNRKFVAAIEQDEDAWLPGQGWEADHMRFDFFARHDVGGAPRAHRPWLTMWYDIRTRCIMGWWIDWTPCGDTIRWSLLDAIQRSPSGPPEYARIDNGKDFKQLAHVGMTHRERNAITRRGGYWLDSAVGTGLFHLLRIKPKFCEVYNHNGKARIEARFNFIHQDFDSGFNAPSGNRPGARDADALARDIADPSKLPTIEQVRREFAEWVAWYNTRADHRIDDLIDDDGQRCSPVEFLLKHTQTRRAMPDPCVLKLLEPRMSPRPLLVRKQGISVRRKAGVLSYGSGCRELHEYKGTDRKVVVFYDTADINHVAVHDAVTMRWICDAPVNAKHGGPRRDAITDAALKEAMALKREQKALAKRKFDMAAVALPAMDLAAREMRRSEVREAAARMASSGVADMAGTAPIRIVQTKLDGEAERISKARAEKGRPRLAGTAQDVTDDRSERFLPPPSSRDEDDDSIEFGGFDFDREDEAGDDDLEVAHTESEFDSDADAGEDPDLNILGGVSP